MKKRIIISIIIIILVLLTLFSFFYSQNRKLSKNDFIKLMQNFKKVSNVKIEGSITKYIKDEYILSISDNNLYTWSNSKTKECISYIPDTKQYSFIEYNDENLSYLENSQYKFFRL